MKGKLVTGTLIACVGVPVLAWVGPAYPKNPKVSENFAVEFLRFELADCAGTFTDNSYSDPTLEHVAPGECTSLDEWIGAGTIWTGQTTFDSVQMGITQWIDEEDEFPDYHNRDDYIRPDLEDYGICNVTFYSYPKCRGRSAGLLVDILHNPAFAGPLVVTESPENGAKTIVGGSCVNTEVPAQSVFMECHRNLPKFDPDADPQTWYDIPPP